MAIDVAEIRKNALAEGIPLSEISVVYEHLNDNQIEELNFQGLLVKDLGSGSVIGRFRENGEILHPEFATGVLHLGA